MCRLLLATAKKDKTFLLADLIIDRLLINGASPIRDTIPISSGLAMSVLWFAYGDRKQRAERVGAMKCAVVANADINLTSMSENGML